MMCFLRGRRGWDIWSLAVPTVSAGTADGKQNPVVQPGSSFLYMPQNNTLLWHFILQFATCLCSTFQHAKWDKMSGLMMLDLESLPSTFLWQCPWVPRSFHIKSLEHKVVNTSLSLSIYSSKQGCHMMTRNTSCLNTEILLCWFPKSPISGCSSSSLVSSSVCVCVCSQSCPNLCDSMDYSPSDSLVHGIFQARILKHVATSFSRGSSRLRDQTCVSCIGRQILYQLRHQFPPYLTFIQ